MTQLLPVISLTLLVTSAFADLPPPVKLNSRQVGKLEAYGTFFNEKVTTNENGTAFSEGKIRITCTGKATDTEDGELTMKNRKCEIGE